MQALEEKLQYHFKNPALLEEALRHSSYANEHRGANFFSNAVSYTHLTLPTICSV